MPDLQISTSGDGIPVQGAGGETVFVSPTPQGLSSQSTIAPSQSQQQQDSWDAQVPYIPPPGMNEALSSVDPSLITMKFNESLNAATMAMLDAWNDSIKESKEKRDKETNDPHNLRLDEEKRHVSGFIDSYLQNVDSTRDATIPFVTVGLIIAGGAAGITSTIMIDTESTRMVGVTPTLDQAVNAPQQNMNDMREWLSILGAALVQGMAYTSTALAVGKTDGTDTVKQNQFTAEQYADNVLALISSGQLNSVLTNVVQSKSPGQPVNTDYVSKLEVQMRVFLLGTALAALYSAGKGGTQHIIGEELQGLISGENKTFGPNKEKMDQVLSLLRFELANITSDAIRTNLLISLFAFIDNNPASNVLKNPAKFFSSFQALARTPEKG